MAFWYHAGLREIVKKTITLSDTAMSLVLVDQDFADAADPTDILIGSATGAQITATNYAVKSSLGITTTWDYINDKVVINIPSQTWSSLGGAANDTIYGAALVEGGTGTLVYFWGADDVANLPHLTDGTNFTLSFANGAIEIRTVDPPSPSGPEVIPGSGWSSSTADPSGTGAKVICRWHDVPYQRIKGSGKNIGVLAFHKSGETLGNCGILKVEFAINGGSWVEVSTPAVNPDTGSWEFYCKVDPANFPTSGSYELRARAYAADGTSPGRTESSMWLRIDKGDLAQPTCYISPSGNDSNPGTELSPRRTVFGALNRLMVLGNGRVDGGMIYCLPGSYTYNASATTTIYNCDYEWCTITKAPSATRDQVILNGPARVDCRLLALSQIKLQDVYFSESSGNHYNSSYWGRNFGSRWVDRCDWDITPPDLVHPDTPAAWWPADKGYGTYRFMNGLAYPDRAYVTGTEADPCLVSRGWEQWYFCQLVRSVRGTDTRGDWSEDTPVVTNCHTNQVYPQTSAGSSADHVDFWQFFRNGLNWDNCILMNCSSLNSKTQHFMLNHAGGPLTTTASYENFAIVNCVMEHKSSIGWAAQIISRPRHMLIWNHTHAGQILMLRPEEAIEKAGSLYQPDPSNPYGMKWVSIIGCATACTTVDKLNNTTAPAYDPATTLIKHTNMTNPGAAAQQNLIAVQDQDATNASTGIYVDPGNSNFRPSASSTLRGRVTVPPVPFDIRNNPRATTGATIGAYED